MWYENKTQHGMYTIVLSSEQFSFCPFSWKNKKEIISNRKSNSVYTHCDISLIIYLFMDGVKLTACFRMVYIFIMVFRFIRIWFITYIYFIDNWNFHRQTLKLFQLYAFRLMWNIGMNRNILLLTSVKHLIKLLNLINSPNPYINSY